MRVCVCARVRVQVCCAERDVHHIASSHRLPRAISYSEILVNAARGVDFPRVCAHSKNARRSAKDIECKLFANSTVAAVWHASSPVSSRAPFAIVRSLLTLQMGQWSRARVYGRDPPASLPSPLPKWFRSASGMRPRARPNPGQVYSMDVRLSGTCHMLDGFRTFIIQRISADCPPKLFTESDRYTVRYPDVCNSLFCAARRASP